MWFEWALNEVIVISVAGSLEVGWGVNPECGVEARVVTGFPIDELEPLFTFDCSHSSGGRQHLGPVSSRPEEPDRPFLRGATPPSGPSHFSCPAPRTESPVSAELSGQSTESRERCPLFHQVQNGAARGGCAAPHRGQLVGPVQDRC